MSCSIFDLPTSCTSEIVSKFLTLQDVARFDSAVCNSSQREKFYVILTNARCLFFADKTKAINTEQKLKWAVSRRMPVLALVADRSMDLKLLALFVKMQRSLQYFDTTRLFGTLADKLACLTSIFANSPDLKCIIGLENALVSEGLMKTLQTSATGLQRLELRRSAENMLNYACLAPLFSEPMPSFNALKLEVIDQCDPIVELLGAQCANLQEFSLDQRVGLDDDSINRNVVREAALAVLSTGCRDLRHLRLCDSFSLQDFAITTVSKNCSKLRKVELMQSNIFTNQVLRSLSENCPSLELLNIAFSEFDQVVRGADPAEDLFSGLSFPVLRELDVRECDLTDADLCNIGQNCEQLAILHCGGNLSSSTMRGWGGLFSACRKLQIFDQWEANPDSSTDELQAEVLVGAVSLLPCPSLRNIHTNAVLLQPLVAAIISSEHKPLIVETKVSVRSSGISSDTLATFFEMFREGKTRNNTRFCCRKK
jgi:hypothetical protein